MVLHPLPFLDSRHLDGPERVCEQRSRWQRTAVNFGAEAPIFDLFDASTDETLAVAGSFAVRSFISPPFSPSFKMESLYSTRSEYFCLYYFPFKIFARPCICCLGKVMVCLVVKQTRDRFRCMQERHLAAA